MYVIKHKDKQLFISNSYKHLSNLNKARVFQTKQSATNALYASNLQFHLSCLKYTPEDFFLIEVELRIKK